jgi:hypothetical protein
MVRRAEEPLGAWEGLAKGRPTIGLALVLLALTIGPLGLIVPRAVRPIFVGWMIAAFPIGWTVAQLLLLFVYLAVVTPLGIALRLAGHDPLRLRLDPAATTHWVPKPQVPDVRRYFRPY